MKEYKDGDSAYQASFGDGGSAGGGTFETRNEALTAFLKTPARKCLIHAATLEDKCGVKMWMYSPFGQWSGKFTRGSAKQALAEGKYSDDGKPQPAVEAKAA